jgi:thiamine biosynthesis lipoprotein
MPIALRIMFFLVVLIGAMSSCSTKQEVKPMIGRYYTGVLFGKPYSIDVVGDSADYTASLDSVIAIYESLFNVMDPKSLISRINQYGSKDSVFSFNDSTRAFGLVYDLARDLHRTTFQYYDPTIAPLRRAWMVTKSRGELEPNLDSLYDFVGFDQSQRGQVLLDMNELTVDGYRYSETQIRKPDERSELDFTGIAAAAALDQVAQLLRDRNVAQFRITYGHSLICEGNVVDTLGVIPMGIGVDSADQFIRVQRGAFCYRTVQDKLAMIDPTYGYPVDNDIVYVGIQAPSLVEAEVFSEAFMIMGLDKASDYYARNETSKIESFMLYNVDKNLQSASTEGFDRLMVYRDTTQVQ